MDYAPAMAKPNPSWWKVWDKPPAPPEEPPILDEGERELLIGNLVRGSGRAPAVSESPFSRPLSSDERRDIAQRVVDEAYGDARRLYFRALELHEQGRYEELEELYDSSWVFRSSASIWMHALTRMSAAVLAAEASLLEKNRRAWDRAFTSGMPELDGLSGEAFESRISGLLRSLGYKTEITNATEDAGGDIIALLRQKTTVVHTKHRQPSWRRGDSKGDRVTAALRGQLCARRHQLDLHSAGTRAGFSCRCRSLGSSSAHEAPGGGRVAPETAAVKGASSRASCGGTRAQPVQLASDELGGRGGRTRKSPVQRPTAGLCHLFQGGSRQFSVLAWERGSDQYLSRARRFELGTSMDGST